MRPKKETIKEIGKISIDIAKIIFGVAILSPFLRIGEVDIVAIITSISLAILGLYIHHKGATDD